MDILFIDTDMVKLVRNKLNWLLFSFIILIGNGCSDYNMDQSFYQDVLGVNIIPQKKVLQYDEESAHNEGFSLEIIQWEVDGELDLKKGFPVEDDYRKGWLISQWKEVSIVDTLPDFDLIFKYHLDKPYLQEKIADAYKALLSSGNYYSYFYKKNSDYIDAVNLYILDVHKRLLYVFYVVV